MLLCKSHNVECLTETLDKFEWAVDITLPKIAAKRAGISL